MNNPIAAEIKNPEVRPSEIETRKKKAKEKEKADDTLKDFCDFKSNFSDKLKNVNNFKRIIEHDKICFVKLNLKNEITDYCIFISQRKFNSSCKKQKFH